MTKRAAKNTDFQIGQKVTVQVARAEGGTAPAVGTVTGRTTRQLHVKFARQDGTTFHMTLSPKDVVPPIVVEPAQPLDPGRTVPTHEECEAAMAKYRALDARADAAEAEVSRLRAEARAALNTASKLLDTRIDAYLAHRAANATDPGKEPPSR